VSTNGGEMPKVQPAGQGRQIGDIQLKNGISDYEYASILGGERGTSVHTIKAGIYDLTFLNLGGFYVLELKDDEGDLSDVRRIMWKRYERAGAKGIAVAKSLSAAKAQIVAWGLTVFC
jgi:hypothetical protein